MKQQCDKCDREAEVHEINPINGTAIHLCREHAKAAGFDVPSATPMASVLGGLGSMQVQITTERRGPAACPGCGLEFARFRKTGLLGCAECYDTFATQLESIIPRSQNGADAHLGHVAHRHADVMDRQARRRTILAELERAVATEQYERAARLRDQLQTLGAETGDSA
jgi:protein arginine kinase activator